MSLDLPGTTASFTDLCDSPAFKPLLKVGGQGESLSINDVSPGGDAFLVAVISQLFSDNTIMVVCPTVQIQEKVHQELKTWLQRLTKSNLQPSDPQYFPAWDILPHESRLPHADVLSERLETLIHLSTTKKGSTSSPLVVTNGIGFLQRTFTSEELKKRFRSFTLGDRIDPLDLIEWLEDQAYEPEAQVTQKGEIALRGGILDIFPLTSPWPIRFEFFGDEIESMRTFDPQTQISRDKIKQATISPGGELGILKQQFANNADFKTSSLADHLSEAPIYIFIEPEEIAERTKDYLEQVPENDKFHNTWEAAIQQVRENERLVELRKADNNSILSVQNLDHYRPLGKKSINTEIAESQRRNFFEQIHRWLRGNYQVWIICSTEGEMQRFDELWDEYGFSKKKKNFQPISNVGYISQGFIIESAKLVVISDSEIFGRYRSQRPRRLKSPHALATRSALEIDFTDLNLGDYVVHLQHGIGRYIGLKTLPSEKRKKQSQEKNSDEGYECLAIEFGSSDPDQELPKLYVPVSEAHLVSKYVGTGKANPPLSILGSKRWSKAKAEAEKAVADLAAELLKIQASREAQPGHAYSKDTPWQREFESAFPYEETPDQWASIKAAKQDMEKAQPMDRLICGDVGFGKTEVAIRAAFKAVMGGRQVAMLVPTTVLAQQHYNTFLERMADFPISVELLSRFRTKKQADETIKGLAAGSTDIVVGTHKLIQDKIRFKDLGLVIIDEEQRFGVLHKEKLKMLRQSVDVITLTATPIPRTLHMALTGARDMSTIETPPQDRLPIETTVIEFDETIIRDAIKRELNRGGQVFFLHNRVTTIETMAERIRKLVPKARLIVGHGQMSSGSLEKVMTQFISGKADILLSTTIIESGVDIPNANTMLIDRADRFGLSELYQLRGRVGRYKHQAYAYLILPKHAALLTDARKRISALKQYSKLGSGFKIAMRDLEIRGAGNILGAQQSGHITAVGFELYCQLLKQSVKRLKGEKVEHRLKVNVTIDFLALQPGEERKAQKEKSKTKKLEFEINIPRTVAVAVDDDEKRENKIPLEKRDIGRVPAYLPFEYIPETRQRITIYRKLAQLFNIKDLKELIIEIRDRFGPIPKSVDRLLRVAELKILAAPKKVTAIETREEKIMFTRNGSLITLGGKYPRFEKRTPDKRLSELKNLLKAL